jgi:hypothetical protein
MEEFQSLLFWVHSVLQNAKADFPPFFMNFPPFFKNAISLNSQDITTEFEDVMTLKH